MKSYRQSKKRSRKYRKSTSKAKSCSKRKISKVMKEWKAGKLKMRNNRKVTNHKQAIAIALNMARKHCGNKSVKKR